MNFFVRAFISFCLFNLYLCSDLVGERHFTQERAHHDIPSKEAQEQIGTYTIVKWLGEGDQGKVYKAVDARQNSVALKIFYTKSEMAKVHPERKKTIEQFFEPDGSSKAANAEFAVAVLCSHSRIMKILDKQEYISKAGEKVTYLVLEYVEGKNLSKISPQSLSKKRSLRLARQLLSALRFSFSKGFIHDDLWGENIFLDKEKNLKLIDLGSFDPLPMIAKGEKPKGTYRKYTAVIKKMLAQILDLGTWSKQEKLELLAQVDALCQTSDDCPMALESHARIEANLDKLLDKLKKQFKPG
jgi:serine/threonine protein kinase